MQDIKRVVHVCSWPVTLKRSSGQSEDQELLEGQGFVGDPVELERGPKQPYPEETIKQKTTLNAETSWIRQRPSVQNSRPPSNPTRKPLLGGAYRRAYQGI